MATALPPLPIFQLACRLVAPTFCRWENDTMKLFDRLWRNTPTCNHGNSTAVRSEIGHNTVRRYYWFCGRCGEKVYIQDWKGNADGVPEAPCDRAITRSHKAMAL